MKLPVLLLFFNRIEGLNAVLESLATYKPEKVYLASDGPRQSVPGERKRIDDIRESVMLKINWNCVVETRFRTENLGCKSAVHDAVQWFFENEEAGIVLEDDVVPSLRFFHFMEDAIIRYRSNKLIGSITGRNELGIWGSEDLFAASRFQCWGWASWSDRILGMNVDIGYEGSKALSEIFEGTMFIERLYLRSVFGLLEKKLVNSWAYPYDLNFRLKGQLQIYPKCNMVKNVGFGADGTHSHSRKVDMVPFFDDFQPKIESDNVFSDDKRYINEKLKSEYGGYFGLFLMSFVKYLWWMRPIVRRFRYIFRNIKR